MQYERAVTRAYVIKIFNVHIRRPNRLGRRCCILRIPTDLATHLISKYFYLKLKNIPFHGTLHSQYSIDENRDFCIIHLVPTDTYRLLTSTDERNFSQLRATKPTLVWLQPQPHLGHKSCPLLQRSCGRGLSAARYPWRCRTVVEELQTPHEPWLGQRRFRKSLWWWAVREKCRGRMMSSSGRHSRESEPG